MQEPIFGREIKNRQTEFDNSTSLNLASPGLRFATSPRQMCKIDRDEHFFFERKPRITFSGVTGTSAHRDGFRQMCRRNLQCRPRDTAVGLWNENENILFSESPRQERRVFLHFPPILRGRFRFRSCLQAILLTCFKLRRSFFTSSCIQVVIRRPRNFFPFVHRRERFASFAHRPEAPTPRGKDDFGPSEEKKNIFYHCLGGWGDVS